LIMGVDRYLLEHLGKLSEVAVYNVADVMAVFLLNCTRPINGVLQPRFANLIARDPEEVQRYLAGALKYLALLLFPGAVGLALAAGPLVRLVSHPDFASAAGMVPVLAVAYVLIGLSNPLYHLVFLRRGGRQFLLLYTLCLAVNVLLNWWLIPSYGGKGAAVATLGCFATYVAGLLIWSEAQTLRVLTGQWRTLGAIAGYSLVMAAVLGAAKEIFPAFDSLVLVPLGVVVYGGLVAATGMIPPREWRLLVQPLVNLKALLGAR
jgi:O-antigen/teichoic acid export membrane protein